MRKQNLYPAEAYDDDPCASFGHKFRYDKHQFGKCTVCGCEDESRLDDLDQLWELTDDV